MLQLHEDAVDELVLAEEDEQLQYNVGDVFFFDSKDHVEGVLEAAKANLERDVTETASRVDSIHSQITSLKKVLYGKFGKSINLEEDPAD